MLYRFCFERENARLKRTGLAAQWSPNGRELFYMSADGT